MGGNLEERFIHCKISFELRDNGRRGLWIRDKLKEASKDKDPFPWLESSNSRNGLGRRKEGPIIMQFDSRNVTERGFVQFAGPSGHNRANGASMSRRISCEEYLFNGKPFRND